MPEYDEFADTYQHWSVTATPYVKVLGPVRG